MNQGRPPDNQILENAFPIRQAVEGMQDGLYLSDLRTGELTYFNQAFMAIFGLSAEEIRAMRTKACGAIHEDRSINLARIANWQKRPPPAVPESNWSTLRTKDGTYHWIAIAARYCGRPRPARSWWVCCAT